MESLLGIIVQWNGSWHTCNPKTKADRFPKFSTSCRSRVLVTLRLKTCFRFHSERLPP